MSTSEKMWASCDFKKKTHSRLFEITGANPCFIAFNEALEHDLIKSASKKNQWGRAGWSRPVINLSLVLKWRDGLSHYSILCKWERPTVLCQLCYRIRAPGVTQRQCCSLVFVCFDLRLRVAGGAPDICRLTGREVLAQWDWTQPKEKANLIQDLTTHSPSERNPPHHWLSPQRQLEWDREREREK